jgi:hypothetical protein
MTNSEPATAHNHDFRSVVAAVFCILAAFFDTFGWLFAVLGIVLLRRSVFRRTTKWALAAVALLPKLLFLGARILRAPAGLSFQIEPSTLATSSSLWAWSIVLISFGVFVALQSRRPPADRFGPPRPETRGPRSLAVLGFVLVAVGLVVLIGPFDGFQRIDDAGSGRWALVHTAWGTRATFGRQQVSLIEGTENHSSRRSSSYSARVTLTDGRTFAMTTKSGDAFRELKKFATTANMPPGRVRIVPYHGQPWTNGPPAFTLRDYVGTYDYADQGGPERRTIEFWVESDRLLGKEAVADRASNYVRNLRNIKVSDTGEMEFELATQADMRKVSEATTAFSLQWSSAGEDARLT